MSYGNSLLEGHKPGANLHYSIIKIYVKMLFRYGKAIGDRSFILL